MFPEDVEALLSFVYQGIVYVSEKKLSSFLQTAELLQIKGLTGAASSFNDEQARQAATPQSPVKRRKSAPVRIVKQEDGEDTNSTQMEGEEEGIVKNEFSEDIIEDTKNVTIQLFLSYRSLVKINLKITCCTYNYLWFG